MEERIMKLILHAGNARSDSFLAIKVAKNCEFEKAESLLTQARKETVKAHKYQTELIQKEASGEPQEISLLLVHAQDHLMTALAIRELASELVSLMVLVEERFTHTKRGKQ